MGVRAREAFCTVPQAIHDTGPEVFHHDVGPRQHALKKIAVSRTFEVQRNAFLAAIETHEVRRLLLDEGAESARVVAGTELLDLYDPARTREKSRTVIPSSGPLRTGWPDDFSMFSPLLFYKSAAIHRAAFSAIRSVGLLVFPLVMVGMTLASTTRKPPMP